MEKEVAKKKTLLKIVINVFLFIFLYCFSLMFVFAISGSPFQEYNLITNGNTVIGYIFNAHDSNEEGTSYRYTYRFITEDDKELFFEVSEPGSLPYQLHDLTNPYPLKITYLKSDPKINKPSKLLSADIYELRKKIGLEILLSFLFPVLGLYAIHYIIKKYFIDVNRRQNLLMWLLEMAILD